MARRRATTLRALVGLSVILVLFMALVPPATAAVIARSPAHASVLSVTPADGSVLDRAPGQIVVVFDGAVNPAFVQVSLSSGSTPVPLGAPSVDGGTVTVPVPPGSAGAAGSYRIAFRVVSADGHPVSGSSEFTLTGAAALTTGAASATSSVPSPVAGPGTSARSGPATASASDQPIAATSASGPSFAPVTVALAGVVVVGGGLLLRRRRRAR